MDKWIDELDQERKKSLDKCGLDPDEIIKKKAYYCKVSQYFPQFQFPCCIGKCIFVINNRLYIELFSGIFGSSGSGAFFLSFCIMHSNCYYCLEEILFL